VNALHEHHDPSGLLVVQSGQQGFAVPIDSAFANDLRKSVSKLNWVVNNEQIAAEAGERALDGSCVTLPAQCGGNFLIVLRATRMSGNTVW